MCLDPPGASLSQSSTFSQDPSQSLNASSVCSADLSTNTPHTKSLRKLKRPQNSASPHFVKIAKSTVLAFPVTSLSKKSEQQSLTSDTKEPVAMAVDASAATNDVVEDG